ncbi:uncharacterized protein LOC132951008 [Metopolophium dirhodum]|uniref:uncharacterized protein LOC132951008 n=1 Tax=Metopolophium dirhodum TaxID=44670 RepID=UPI0029905F6E|nr:uncharacterized protein LOC132951008 [Metopolophium dirhodum]
MKYYIKKERGNERKLLRCKRKGCQTTQSIRKNNSFWTYIDKNGRNNSGLSIGAQLELVYYWCQNIKQTTITSLTGRSHNTVCDWMNLCRNVPVRMFENRSKLGGLGIVIQVDECLLRGSRKNNKGRLRLADLPAENLNVDSENVNPLEHGARNYGKRLDRPWVFGLWDNKEGRYFVVQKRDKTTLHEIIQREVIAGSIIHSDGWSGYNGLSDHGYNRYVVNHSENFVDPISKAHTQRIESLWRPLRLKIVKNMCGTTPDLLPRYLIETWWRGINKSDTFNAFLRDMAQVF